MAAATRTGNAITFDALTDTYTGIVEIAGITFQGASLTAGDLVSLQDSAGDPIVDYLVEGTADNADFWNGRPPKFYHGLKIGAGSLATGTPTFKLTVFTN